MKDPRGRPPEACHRRITPSAVERWRTARLKSGVKPITVNKELGALKATLSRAVEWNGAQGVVGEQPAAGNHPARVARSCFRDSQPSRHVVVISVRGAPDSTAKRHLPGRLTRMKATARVPGVVALGVISLAVCPMSALAGSDREVALHSVVLALMLLDDARTALIDRERQPSVRVPPSHAAGRLRDAARVLENKTPTGSMRSAYDGLKREVEQLSAALNTLPESDEKMRQLVRNLYERQAEPAFVRVSALAREAVGRGLADGGPLGDDERVRLITAVVGWMGERVAGVRHQTWEQLLLDCPEVTYVREGPRCRFLTPGGRLESEACARTAAPNDSPLAQAASQILMMFQTAASTPTTRH